MEELDPPGDIQSIEQREHSINVVESQIDAINILLIEPLLAIWRLSPEIKARYAVTAAAIFLQLSHAEF
jgi:hypothetical protein